ncbi:lipoprotein BA_5634 family protein [Sutcliffiella halmapala]|uniref:lipoprotein BA_5634 family protein n=1 Tax=Sutcliffiella halmapala TaxID=79882 RepID=UPI0009957047|nr:lipoprotein BA_5634 family protein [Sutcliffiella halmapala]
MRKLIGVSLTVVIAGALMIGWSAIKDSFVKANGVILYGDHNQIEEVLNQEKNVKEKVQYKFKIFEDGEQKIMIIDETTANALVNISLIKEVKEEPGTEAIKSIPRVTKGKGLLFAKETTDNIDLDGQVIQVSYEGNKIIGDGRVYSDMFLIMNDMDWSVMKGTEKSMGIIEYAKDPAKKLGEFNVEGVQLVKIIN